MKFSIKDFFSKYDQIRSFRRISSHLLQKSLMENFIFCAVFDQLKESDFWRRLDFTYCFIISTWQNNGVLANVVIGDKTCFFMNDTFNTFVMFECMRQELMCEILCFKEQIRVKKLLPDIRVIVILLGVYFLMVM